MADAIDSEVSDELFHTANTHIHESIDKVYTQKELEDYQTVNELKRNASEFAIRKASYYTQAMKGKEPEVQTAIMNTYERQLQVEANFATRATRSAKQWQEYQRKKHIYPNLEYLPSSSADPRPEHEVLYGTILPLDDPFWNTNFPPNDWGCKCSTAASRDDATGTPENIPRLPTGIPGNPGKELKVFSDNNSFERRLSDDGKKMVENALETKKKTIPFGKRPNFKFKNKGEIYVHPFADDADMKMNVDYGKVVVKNHSGKLEILPDSKVTGDKNPEYRYNGVVGDRTEWKRAQTIEKYIKNTFVSKVGTKGQLKGYDKNFIAMDFLGKLNDENLLQLVRKINGELNMPNKNTSLQFLILKNESKTLIINKGENYGTILKKAKELL